MTDTASPMMAQYLEIKAAHPDALLFYRMGDFYEMFFEDAAAAAAALDIALTKRGMHAGRDIPMCGVPVQAAEGYLLTLIRKGFRVAVAEQTEDPAEARRRGTRAVVQREVVRLVTPGTLTEESLLEARRHNFLAAWAELRDEGALAAADISTGSLTVMPCSRARLAAELARLAPRELLVGEGAGGWVTALGEEAGAAVTPLGRASFDSQAGTRRIAALYGVRSADAFGAFGRAELAALGAVIDYLEITQKGRLPHMAPPRREDPGGRVQIDAATRRNLEIAVAQSGGREGSLLAAVDRTLTAAGGRLVERRLSDPSRDLGELLARQQAVALLVEDAGLREALRDRLRGVPDLDRALSRLALDRGGPRDLAAVRRGLAAGEAVAALLSGTGAAALAVIATTLAGHGDLVARLAATLVEDPPALVRDGGFVRPGCDGALDEALRLRDEGRGVIAAMEADYQAEAGIPSLKIRHNNVLGYHIETTATHAERMRTPPLAGRFRHRQTTANALRFATPELAELEARILNAGATALEIEARIFAELAGAVLARAAAIAAAARALAEADVHAAFAERAAEDGWCRPELDDGRGFLVEGGRHPVVEAALRRAGTPFVANDCLLTEGGEAAAIWLVTGPNMGGKSTFLRQNALIALLAQSGAFVPARRARIGLVSQIFSRVGASDDLARGRSTFLVEMVETAAILNAADDRALVILDEIGRGTATWDGLSIAWATLEYLHDINRCRGLFATHYHEMTALARRLAGLRNATLAVREWRGDLVFLHEVRPGAADRSYGVQVARLAGLPAAVVARARVLLDGLERGEREGGRRRAAVIDDLPLFAAAADSPAPPAPSPVEARLARIQPDEMSPREALAALYDLKALAAGSGGAT